MFKTSEGETLDLAPWRMRRFVRLLAEARSYPADTPPHVLIQDLRQIIARARRVKTEPRIGTARFQSSAACCNACLLARQRDGMLSLLGLSFTPGPYGMRTDSFASSGSSTPARDFELEFEDIVRSARLDLAWSKWQPLADAISGVSGSGVYLLTRNQRPVYVGQSDALKLRLGQHLWFSQCHRDPGKFGVWTANVPAKHMSTVEHTLVRALRQRVSNVLLQKQFTVGPGGLRITNLLPTGVDSPHAPGNQAVRNKDETFEWSP
ncbi:GIY-YIG nuclease family protein [Caballeronia sp. ATUFL_F1_KS39]|uniref:GIY-YIG nuclease family protein n=1 Tax=Caballeronia sp. ATUFL_F1_KS39 TaxID=2921766 RepID=UPI0020289395|nr:GIY-YIG nuclease family protein [Caballeronia sp. ATUFL_F1_KS39]